MRSFLTALSLATAGLVAAPAAAQDAGESTASAPTVRQGMSLVTSDGRRLGRIVRVLDDASGTPVSASVIVQSRFAYIPLSTITAEGRTATTTLSYADIRAQR